MPENAILKGFGSITNKNCPLRPIGSPKATLEPLFSAECGILDH